MTKIGNLVIFFTEYTLGLYDWSPIFTVYLLGCSIVIVGTIEELLAG